MKRNYRVSVFVSSRTSSGQDGGWHEGISLLVNCTYSTIVVLLYRGKNYRSRPVCWSSSSVSLLASLNLLKVWLVTLPSGYFCAPFSFAIQSLIIRVHPSPLLPIFHLHRSIHLFVYTCVGPFTIHDK